MKFKLFDSNRDGKGVDKNEDITPNLSFYFKSLWRKFPKLISVNLMMLVPLLVPLLAFLIGFWTDKIPTVTNPSYPALFGLLGFSDNPGLFASVAMNSIQTGIPVLSLGRIAVIAGLLLVFAVFFGPINAGFTYLMRELVRGNAVFLFSDFFYAFRKNFKQAFGFGLFDFAVLGTLIFNFSNTEYFGTGILGSVVYGGNVAIVILYSVMRFYAYLMMITFDIKFGKLLKNSLIFVILGLKRNALAALWIFLLIALDIFVFVFLFPSLLPLGIVIPALNFPAVALFTINYAAYPIIQKYMIDPYEKPLEPLE